jgi:chromosome segregation ATPase
MAEANIQRSNSVSTIDGNHDQVVFENVPDQYVKGENVTAHFTILRDIKVDPSEDQIGLLRVGSTNIQECLAYAPVELDSTTRHGTATFPSSSLPATDDEFYQFCYIIKKRKCLGSSIPFQLNCSIDDIDLLSQSLMEKTQVKSNNNGLFSFADNDNDDMVVIQTKRMLVEEKLRQENRQLLEINRRLEQQKDECKAKFDLLDSKSNEYINKVKNDMQLLATTHKATIDELSTRQRLEAKLRTEYDACRSLCNQIQSESLQFAERCRTLEDSNNQLSNESNKLRSQLSLATQLTDEQNIQILDFEKRLLQSNESLKSANQYQLQLEQQLRDLRLTTEKYQISMQAQIDAYTKQASQQENQIHALESANNLLKDELNSVQTDNTFLITMAKDDKRIIKELEERIYELNEERRTDNEETQNELEILRHELEQSEGLHNDYMTLKSSFNEIEKRCVKHQKSEIEVKKQLTVYKEFVNDSQGKVHELTERLLAGADEYKSLYRKYAALERMIAKANQQNQSNPTTLSNETGLNEEALVKLLRNSYELQQKEEKDDEEKNIITAQHSLVDEEIRECPMCYWEFPHHLTLEAKNEHIENHFA